MALRGMKVLNKEMPTLLRCLRNERAAELALTENSESSHRPGIWSAGKITRRRTYPAQTSTLGREQPKR